eukprot:jgi/Ulvmu1/2657/UM014_0111.1
MQFKQKKLRLAQEAEKVALARAATSRQSAGREEESDGHIQVQTPPLPIEDNASGQTLQPSAGNDAGAMDAADLAAAVTAISTPGNDLVPTGPLEKSHLEALPPVQQTTDTDVPQLENSHPRALETSALQPLAADVGADGGGNDRQLSVHSTSQGLNHQGTGAPRRTGSRSTAVHRS